MTEFYTFKKVDFMVCELHLNQIYFKRAETNR